MAIVENTAHGKIVSRLCKIIVILTYLTRAFVESNVVEEVGAIQSDFGKSVIKNWLDLDNNTVMDVAGSGYTRKQSLFNTTQVRYKSKPLFVPKCIKAELKLVSHIVSDNTWETILDIRDEIGDYAGLKSDYWTVINAVKRKWNDSVTNPTNVTIEEEGNIECNISDMAVTFFKLSNKEIRNIIIKSKSTPVCSISYWKRVFGIDIERYFGIVIRAYKQTRY